MQDVQKLVVLLLVRLLCEAQLPCVACKASCRAMRKCYKTMLKDLTREDEVHCVRDTTVGLSTIIVFLRALQQYCGQFISVTKELATFEEREMFEVVVTNFNASGNSHANYPAVLLEAGQDVSSDAVSLVLHTIEQLVACQENEYMLNNLKWVFIPCTNPDGLEFARFNRLWKKNMRIVPNKIGMGVDITRNFDIHWDQCGLEASALSDNYIGPHANSENETMFILNILHKYKSKLIAYVSIRGGGHGIGIPYAHTDHKQLRDVALFKKIASYLAGKANRKVGNLQSFSHSTIFEANGKPVCGHSVDYAQGIGINSVEWKVYIGSTEKIVQMFHDRPKVYLNAVRNGYFTLIKEAHNVYHKFEKFKEFFAKDFDKIYSLK